ncbi:methyl-accepting chemotaxis protein [Desulfonatronum lacustre]|uniref:methyl-accepting chemotaxis protein n=1 Tax=Desulfonatronum lacustre TaxID=66849 RepID=UPI0004AE5BCB|nr:methyl-accepting chemotaxis protein [Desulfonatronum lacustre]
MAKLAAPPTMSRQREYIPTESDRTANELAEKRRIAKERAAQRATGRTVAKRQQAAERIASATEELASGIAQANAAAEQMNKAMEQISSGATEASAAAQESQAAAEQLNKGAQVASNTAQSAMEKTDTLQELVRLTSSDIESIITNVGLSAERNMESARMISELERQADEIGQVVRTVAGIADQTNLLALNAAIEAARAGEHGRGFAVVADEVRNLAEGAEKSARSIRELITDIQKEVKVVAKDVQEAGVTGKDEVEKGRAINQQLLRIDKEMQTLSGGCSSINDLSTSIAAAIVQFLKGVEIIAAAAEESASAAAEASSSTAEQMKAMKDIEMATEELAQMAEDLKVNTDSEKSSEQLASTAEQLSATISQANAASQQIMSAIRQIAKGAEQQGSATEESAAAINQVNKQSQDIATKAADALEQVNSMVQLLEANKEAVDKLIVGISESAKASATSAQNVKNLETRVRQIDKIVDAITSVAMQTNMLAVNGAIEAARAGEYGKGFAVVASDIRTLANDSEQNAEKIKDLVRGIQDQVLVVSRDILDVGALAEREMLNAKKSNADLQRIEKDISEVHSGIQNIQRSAEESAVAVEQAQKGVEQIASAAQQSSSAAQQASASATQQAKGMQELSQAIEDISALADELQTA